MSASSLVVVTCDGPRLGVACQTPPSTLDGTLSALRASLRRAGWTWPHTGDRRVDLCPACAPRAVLTPHRVGRPPKR